MKLENTKAQMRKGILEFCILSILDKKEAYPSEIIDTLKDDTNVFVISHKTELEDAHFERKLTFVKDKNFSRMREST